MITEGQAVVVTERHDDFYTSEGRVIRVTDDDTVPVAIVDFQGDPNGNAGRRRIPLSHLGAMPAPGERYEWADRNNASRTPFTVGERFSKRHQYAGYFRILSDDANGIERDRGYSSIASAAELAKYADRRPAADVAPLPSLADRMRHWVEAGMPRPGQQCEGGPGAPVLDFAAEVDDLRKRADALADAVGLLHGTRNDFRTMQQWDAVGAALTDYRRTQQS